MPACEAQVLLDPMMGMVDTAIVGRLGTEPLAAVGLATVVFNMSCFVWWVSQHLTCTDVHKCCKQCALLSCGCV